MMYWDTEQYSYLWQEFRQQTLSDITRKYSGDQDWISAHLNPAQLRYFDYHAVKSWRWQIFDGGIDTATRRYHAPDQGCTLDPATAVVIFHGSPKPHEVTDPAIAQLWSCQNDK